MKYYYGEFDGEPFPTQDALFQFDNLSQFILQHGEQALRAIEQMLNDPDNPNHSDLLEQLLKEGMFDKDAKGKLRLTPKAVGRMQRRALNEIFANLRQGQRDGHEKVTAGQGGERIEGTKPYQFGDPVSELDLHATIRNAMQRTAAGKGQSASRSTALSPIRFSERDFELHLHEGTTSCST
ncbi:MAG TPA: hypothetical protein PLD59_11320, partial [Tepidisphaeraceae bacterium]|nr:hypothetical protein [Tepidisphaeraceae bacterium]